MESSEIEEDVALASFSIVGEELSLHHDEGGLQICTPQKCLILSEATASEAMGLIELFKTMEEGSNGRSDS